jgi:hypothetical protein
MIPFLSTFYKPASMNIDTYLYSSFVLSKKILPHDTGTENPGFGPAIENGAEINISGI